MATIFTAETFKAEVIDGKKTALVDFYADWCGPCKMMAPIVDMVGREYEGKLLVGKVNVDDESDIAADYDVMSIPTIIIFKDGKPVATNVGAISKDQLVSLIEANL